MYIQNKSITNEKYDKNFLFILKYRTCQNIRIHKQKRETLKKLTIIE